MLQAVYESKRDKAALEQNVVAVRNLEDTVAVKKEQNQDLRDQYDELGGKINADDAAALQLEQDQNTLEETLRMLRATLKATEGQLKISADKNIDLTRRLEESHQNFQTGREEEVHRRHLAEENARLLRAELDVLRTVHVHNVETDETETRQLPVADVVAGAERQREAAPKAMQCEAEVRENLIQIKVEKGVAEQDRDDARDEQQFMIDHSNRLQAANERLEKVAETAGADKVDIGVAKRVV